MTRDWSSVKTAIWWNRANNKYEARMENEPSESYFKDHFDFESVLEVGSGTGRLINMLNAKKKAALDINPHLLELVDNDVAKFEYDISKPIITGYTKYDLVYTFQVLQHLTPGQLKAALKNIRRMAKKEIWLLEGQVAGSKDGEMTSKTGSWHHDYEKYLNCYQIDSLHGGKIKVFREKQ